MRLSLAAASGSGSASPARLPEGSGSAGVDSWTQPGKWDIGHLALLFALFEVECWLACFGVKLDKQPFGKNSNSKS